MTTITIRDEELSGASLGEFSLDFLTENITVRELIRSRVYQQIQDANLKGTTVFSGIVAPGETEEMLNGKKGAKPRNWKSFYERVVKAYEKNQILVIVDDKQTESLDELVELCADTQITFVRLVLLIGG